MGLKLQIPCELECSRPSLRIRINKVMYRCSPQIFTKKFEKKFWTKGNHIYARKW